MLQGKSPKLVMRYHLDELKIHKSLYTKILFAVYKKFLKFTY